MPNYVANKIVFDCSTEEYNQLKIFLRKPQQEVSISTEAKHKDVWEETLLNWKLLCVLQENNNKNQNTFLNLAYKPCVENDIIFTFNSLVPLPVTLNILSGGIECRAKKAIEKIDYIENNIFAVTEEMFEAKVKEQYDKEEHHICSFKEFVYYTKILRNNKFLFCNHTWYGWCIANWGTKWDAMDAVFNDEEKSLYFLTAWSCPIPILEALSKKFPSVDFCCVYAGEDSGGYYGEITYDSKTKTLELNDSMSGDEAYEKAWGFAPKVEEGE